MKKSTIVEIKCCLLSCLFIYASISKISDYKEFIIQLKKSPFISGFASYITWFLPVVEILIALLLNLNKYRLTGLYFSLFLLSLFTSYLIAMLSFSYYIPCSCGGLISKLSWNEHIVFNIFFMIINIVAILLLSDQSINTIQNNCMQQGKPKT